MLNVKSLSKREKYFYKIPVLGILGTLGYIPDGWTEQKLYLWLLYLQGDERDIFFCIVGQVF